MRSCSFLLAAQPKKRELSPPAGITAISHLCSARFCSNLAFLILPYSVAVFIQFNVFGSAEGTQEVLTVVARNLHMETC